MKWSLWVSLLPAGFCIIGTIFISFVMSIYWKDWCRRKGLKVCDQILLSMAFTSTSLQWVVTLSSIVFYMEDHMVVPKEIFFCFFVLDFVLIEATFWQLAILSTYYCVKLFDFTFPFFRWVKRLISGYTIHLLLISAAFCLAINVPFVWALHVDSPQNVTEDRRGTDYMAAINIYYSGFKITCCCLPFAITLTCIVLSVGSIVRHVWRIRSNALQFSSSPQLGGHIQAAAIMVLCMALDLSFFITVTVVLATSFQNGVIEDSIHWAIFTSYPTTRSMVVIIGNPQLRGRMLEMCASSS